MDSLLTIFKVFVKGVINPKNEFFTPDTNFISFWSTRALLDLFLKSHKYFLQKSQKLDAIKARIFSLTFLLFLQTMQLPENIRSHTTSQTLLYGYKKSAC